MRDRLIKLIDDFCRGDYVEKYIPTQEAYDFFIAATAFADYLLDNGVIVPPCKVGDKVYVISQGQGFNMRWDVYEGEVTDIHMNAHSDIEIRASNGEKFFGYYKPWSVFLRREEAERALKGGVEK